MAQNKNILVVEDDPDINDLISFNLSKEGHLVFQATDGEAGIEKAREIVVTFGLLTTILFVRKYNSKDVASAVALFISAGYWFTSSTSFSNPAVTIARMFTDTFTGIGPSSVIYFITVQIFGALLAKYSYKKLAVGVFDNFR